MAPKDNPSVEAPKLKDMKLFRQQCYIDEQ